MHQDITVPQLLLLLAKTMADTSPHGCTYQYQGYSAAEALLGFIATFGQIWA
jgi:hypothetical protein